MVNEEGAEGGLRERKKRRTRRTIADVATGLFLARGFETVTIVEVARVAEVSVNTIFNYFPTKEDLVFDRQAEVEEAWARVVRERPPGESAVAALQRNYVALLAQRDTYSGLNDDLVAFARLIESSPSLLARERLIGERSEAALARTLAVEAGSGADDLLARVAASQIAGLYSVLHAENRRRLLAGESAETIYPDALAAARRAFALLTDGIGTFCTRATG